MVVLQKLGLYVKQINLGGGREGGREEGREGGREEGEDGQRTYGEHMTVRLPCTGHIFYTVSIEFIPYTMLAI